jgi:beta-glucanase (GH16 family)
VRHRLGIFPLVISRAVSRISNSIVISGSEQNNNRDPRVSKKRPALIVVGLLLVLTVSGAMLISRKNISQNGSSAATSSGSRDVQSVTGEKAKTPITEAKPKTPTSTPKSSTTGSPATQPTAGFTSNAGGPKLVFSDEFNGAANSAPDATKWQVYGGKNPSRWGLECFVNDREHITHDGQGHMVMTASHNPEGVPCTNGSGLYKSGGMNTGAATGGLFNYQYGTTEARIKVPCQSGTGLWPAWWSTGPNWPTGGEVDFLEIMSSNGAGNNAKQSLHGATSSGAAWHLAKSYVASALWCGDYHTYGSIWKPGEIKFTVDGSVTHTITPASIPAGGLWPFDSNKQRLILDLQVGSYGGTVNNSTLPQSMLVDYVRVYQ